MRLLDGINDTEDEVYSFDAIMSMKKKLTIEDAFDDIKLICDNVQFDEEFSIYEEYQEQFDIIEYAIKELHERREMMQRFNEACEPHIIEDEVYKKAKAFDIVKKKGLTIWWFKQFNSYEEYKNKGYEDLATELTKEEYDLLKEVLE